MGRKRHIVVDTIGMLLAIVVHPADIQDRDGARLVMDNLKGRVPRLRLIWADAGYAGQLVDWIQASAGYVLQVVRRPRGSHQFAVLPRRWVVERTLAWTGRCRRLSKDYEALPENVGSLGAYRNGPSHAQTPSSVMTHFANTFSTRPNRTCDFHRIRLSSVSFVRVDVSALRDVGGRHVVRP